MDRSYFRPIRGDSRASRHRQYKKLLQTLRDTGTSTFEAEISKFPLKTATYFKKLFVFILDAKCLNYVVVLFLIASQMKIMNAICSIFHYFTVPEGTQNGLSTVPVCYKGTLIVPNSLNASSVEIIEFAEVGFPGSIFCDHVVISK